MSMTNLNQYWAQLIVEELVRNDVNYFCIAPGSRSTPLVVAAARHPRAKRFIGYDERSLAFHALGYARATNSPAAVITTSGTAVANLYPAVAEASLDGVPMLLLTADRPPELIDTGANQTIRQDCFFGTYARWSTEVPCPTADISPTMVLTTIDQAVYQSKTQSPGPVHLNCRFREPLEPQETPVSPGYTNVISTWQNSGRPFTVYESPKLTIQEEQLCPIKELIEGADRGMIVVGQLTAEAQRNAVSELADCLQWPVYADITSGLRFSGCPALPIRYYDQQLLSNEFDEHVKPSVVLHFGSHTTSKRVWQYFDQNCTQRYVVIKESSHRYDPAHYVSDHFQTDIADFCNRLSQSVASKKTNRLKDYFEKTCTSINTIIQDTIQDTETLTEPFVSRTISELLPDDSCLFLSNSMPVRDMDLYGAPVKKDICIATNRGVSGIDGILSTATGFAASKNKMLTLVIGDLAMVHDLNALSLLNKISVPVVIVVINNRGGGIFDFLPIAQSKDVFEDYFTTPHDFDFKGACEMFKIQYAKVVDKIAFTELYQTAVTNRSAMLIEVVTDRTDNLKLRKRMKAKILQQLQQSIEQE